MARAPSPAIRRRELGARLRAHRQAADLTVEEVAARLMVSGPKISRLETAQRGANLRDVRDLAELYGLGSEETEDLMRLARESQRRSSWQQFSSQISDYAELEEAAVSIRDYESAIVPALLQSPAYARALTLGTAPNDPLEQRNQSYEARMARQKLVLAGNRPPHVMTVIDEAALRRVVGGTAVMHEQMGVLVERAQLPNVTVQVIPFEAGAHPGMDSTFIILGFEESVSDVVFVEGLIGSIYLKSRVDTDRYRSVFQFLQERSLDSERSIDKITSIKEAYAP